MKECDETEVASALLHELDKNAPSVNVQKFMRVRSTKEKHITGVLVDFNDSEVGELAAEGELDKGVGVNLEGFFDDVHKEMKDAGAGYIVGIQLLDSYRAIRSYGLARKARDGAVPWSGDIPMHLASTSKFITAVALHAQLRTMNLNIDKPVVDYLPEYWQPHSSLSEVAIRQLLLHESGIRDIHGKGGVSFTSAKKAVEDGVNPTDISRVEYDNRNYTLLRIILSIIQGGVKRRAFKTWSFDNLIDWYWDIASRDVYEQVCNDKVFSKVSLSIPLRAPPKAALAYSNDTVDEAGFNSANEAYQGAGPIGWFLSMSQWLDVLQGLYDGRIMSVTGRISLFSAFRFGSRVSSQVPSTGTLKSRNFGGSWGESGAEARRETNVFRLTNKGYEVALFQNSASPPNAETVLRNALHDNLIARS